MDAQSDFWALGVILYQMVSGIAPFAAPDTRRLERLIVSRRPPPSLDAVCTPALQAVVAKLLAPQPELRYETAAAIRDDLSRYQAGQETRAQEEGWPARVDEPPTQRTTPVQSVQDEATRRTRVEPDAEATRATEPVQARQPAPTVQPQPAAQVAVAKARRPRRIRQAMMIAALFLVINEVMIGNAAERAAASAVTRELGDMDELWTQYDQLARRSYLGIAVAGLERALQRRTRELTDRVFENYRSSEPTVREPHWKMAREALRHALTADPGDSRIKASLRYCEGHLHRIDGEAKKARRQLPEAKEELTEAVAAFREAAEARAGWPDPFLGLMRTFIYGLEDIDRGSDALKQAQKLGFTAGARETIQLADGYRTRGETLMRTARTLEGLPQETEYLQRAAESLREALTHYGRAAGMAGVVTSVVRTQRAIERIELRLAELAEPQIDIEKAIKDLVLWR